MSFLIMLMINSFVFAAPEGQCISSDQSNRQMMEKCEDFDESRRSCDNQKNCFWINYNEPITTCASIEKSDEEFCEDFDTDEEKCKKNDRKCIWHNLGLVVTECLPATSKNIDPAKSENFNYCKAFDKNEEACEKNTDKKCVFKITVPRLQAPESKR